MSEDGSVRRIVDGRWVVSRAWVMEHTGASAATVARWYAQREQYPAELRFPQVACTLDRTHYYVQEDVEAFWTAWKEDVGTGRLQAAGRPPGDGRGNHGGGHGRAQRDRAVAVVIKELRAAGRVPARHGRTSRTRARRQRTQLAARHE
ncbi:hypothetical protein CP966_02710 [Streptomyces galilaeus]|nr:hypothetical protein CP966_02710 [Streptomyces galilaeus]